MKMKKIVISAVVLLIVITGIWLVFFSKGRPPAKYREVVGPAGNPYADPDFYKKPASIPVEMLPGPVLKSMRYAFPDYKESFIEKRERESTTFWRIEALCGDKRVFIEFKSDGNLERAYSEINDFREAAGRIFYEGKIEEISLKRVRKNVLQKAEWFQFGRTFTHAYSVDGISGHRYFIQYGSGEEGIVFSMTDDGEIRAAGSASDMLTPFIPLEIESPEAIASNLSKYGDKYHVEKIRERIQQQKQQGKKSFRFIVVGDTRDNSEIWEIIARSINKWKPDFAINLGDMTRYGYSNTMDAYLFAVLEKYAKYPIFPVIGNHDCRGGNAYEYAFGEKSRVYFFDCRNCRFIILDNTDCAGGMKWEDQLVLADRWLSEAGKKLKFVFIHLPPSNVEKWAYHSMPLKKSTPFVNLMTKHDVDHVFCGHIHAYSTATFRGVDYSVVGGGGAPLHSHYGDLGSVNHYLVVDVSVDFFSMKLVRFLPEGPPED